MQKTTQQRNKKKRTISILTKQERISKLFKIFQKHIGRVNEISQIELFEKLYGSFDNYTDLQFFYLWSLIRGDLNYLRKRTNCFIGSRILDKEWKYFVVRDSRDAQYYINISTNLKKKLDFMMKKCEKAVQNRYWTQIKRGQFKEIINKRKRV